tara:strand:- start:1277 stop:1450 length:174 start_codon:yes stop_codon:yes gene_type:complete
MKGMRAPKKVISNEPCFILPTDIDKADFDGMHLAAKILLSKRQVSGRRKVISLSGKK